MTGLRDQQKLTGDVRPIVVNVMNFARAPEGKPTLISFEDARTLFHEFGHALHGLLSDATYPLISGTSVWRAISSNCPRSFTSTGWNSRRCCAASRSMRKPASRCPRRYLDKVLAARKLQPGFCHGRIHRLGAGRSSTCILPPRPTIST